MLFATEGKDHAVWLKFVAALEKPNGHRHAIPQAGLDMSPAYQKTGAFVKLTKTRKKTFRGARKSRR